MAKEVVVDIKVSAKQAQKNLDELNESFKLQEDLIEEIQKDLLKYEKQLGKTSKTNVAARSNLNKKILDTKNRLKEEQNGLRTVTKERKRANDELKKATKNQKDYSGVLSIVDRQTGGLISGFKGLTASISGVTKGTKLLGAAFIASGIGAVVLAVTSLAAAFSRSEEGQNKFAEIMTYIKTLIGGFADLLADLGELIIGVFENPKQAWEDFTGSLRKGIRFIYDQVIGRVINAFRKGMLNLQKGILKARIAWNDFTADSAEANALRNKLAEVNGEINQINKSTRQLNDEFSRFVNITGDKLVSKLQNVQQAARAAKRIQEQINETDKIERDLLVERAKAQRDINILREKAAAKEEFTAQQRIGFLKEAAAIEKEITDEELAVAKRRQQEIVNTNLLTKSSKEDKEAEAQARAKVIELEAKSAKIQKTLTAEITTALREAEADRKALEADEKARIKELEDFRKQIREASALTEDEKRELELQKIDDHYAALRARAIEDKILTDAELDMLDANNRKAKEIKQAEFDKQDEDKRKQDEEKRKQDAIAFGDFIQQTLEQNAQKELELDQQRIAHKKMATDAIIGLIGAETAVGKAALIARQIINAQELISNAKTTLAKIAQDSAGSGVAVGKGFAETLKAGFPQNIPLLIAYTAQAAGIVGSITSAVGKAKSTIGSVGGGGGAIPSASVSAPSTTSAPPAFNVVGASPSNQLATAITGQVQRPLKTFVVSGDVSTAQELDRNIVKEAGLG